MTKRLQIYKCEVCGNIVEVLHEGKGELVCCGQPMKLYEENTVDAAKEKHVPVIEKIEGGTISKSVFILAVINGANGEDITILDNKQQVGEYFVSKDLNNVTDAYSVISNIDATSNSLKEAISLIDNMIP